MIYILHIYGGGLVAKSCPPLCGPMTVACQASLSNKFPGKNTGVACHFLLLGIFPPQGWNPGVLQCRRIPGWLIYQGSPCSRAWLCLRSVAYGDVLRFRSLGPVKPTRFCCLFRWSFFESNFHIVRKGHEIGFWRPQLWPALIDSHVAELSQKSSPASCSDDFSSSKKSDSNYTCDRSKLNSVHPEKQGR